MPEQELLIAIREDIDRLEDRMMTYFNLFAADFSRRKAFMDNGIVSELLGDNLSSTSSKPGAVGVLKLDITKKINRLYSEGDLSELEKDALMTRLNQQVWPHMRQKLCEEIN